MLTKLTYPTGGYSCFEYEPNRFDDEYYYPDAADRFGVSVVGYKIDIVPMLMVLEELIIKRRKSQ